MGRPIEVPDEDVIKAGAALLAENKAVNAARLWSRLGKRGRPDRMITVWNEHAKTSALAPHEPSSLSPLPEPAARLLSDCKAELGAGMDACVHEIYAIAERTLVARFQAELAATEASRAAHRAELHETLHALGELADEHNAALLQVQDSARDLLIAQTTLQAERESHARIELDRAALSARVDSLIADLSATACLVQWDWD